MTAQHPTSQNTWENPRPLRPRIAAKIQSVVLFDIDGTLVNGRGTTSRAMVQALSDVFAREVNTDNYYMGGRTDAQIAVELMARVGLSEAETLARLPEVWTRYIGVLDETLPEARPLLLPGAWELLERLARSDWVLVGLLTGNQCEGAFRKVSAVGVDGFFHTGAFGDVSINRNDLAPIALGRIQHVLGREVDPSAVTIVGDTPADVACARSAGLRALAVASGRYDETALRETEPDDLFASLEPTPQVIAALRG